ncbi:MAG: ParB/RepB/Spo0J family partition protein [Clostridia bacterium]|nr:ParB/RepB/Spo0J family partition protein [Clostridia bacterium]
MHTIADKKLLMLRPCDIISSGNTPRQFFNPDEMRLLADSISVNGIIHPLAVRKGVKGKYLLITGERRLRAAKMAGLRRIPCILHKADDETADFYAMVENLQHSDLNMFEQARKINALIFERSLSQAEVSVRLGITQSSLSAKLRLLRLDNLTQSRILEYRLSEEHARALLRMPESRRPQTADIIFSRGLNAKQSEELISELLNPKRHTVETVIDKPEVREPVQNKKTSIGDMRLFANSLIKLTETLGTSGIEAGVKTTETSKYIEYRIRIEKSSIQATKQLKIC